MYSTTINTLAKYTKNLAQRELNNNNQALQNSEVILLKLISHVNYWRWAGYGTMAISIQILRVDRKHPTPSAQEVTSSNEGICRLFRRKAEPNPWVKRRALLMYSVLWGSRVWRTRWFTIDSNLRPHETSSDDHWSGHMFWFWAGWRRKASDGWSSYLE